MVSDENDSLELVVSEQAHLILSTPITSTSEPGGFSHSNAGDLHSLYYGSPQTDLRLRDDVAFDYTIGAVRALVTTTIYQLRYVLGDITASVFKRHVQDSSDAFHRMIDSLVSSEGTLDLAWICANYFSVLCRARYSFPEDLSGFVSTEQMMTLRKDNIRDQISGSRPLLHRIRTPAVRDSLRNNYLELIDMANNLTSRLGETIKSLPPPAKRLLIGAISNSLLGVRTFVELWHIYSDHNQVSLTQSWDTLKDVEDQMLEISWVEAEIKREKLEARLHRLLQMEEKL